MGSDSSSVLAFATVAALLVVTPGVGTAFLLSTVVAHGRRAGLQTAAGMVVGSAVYATLAAVGTAMLVRRFPAALGWIAIVGGAYISYLGARSVLRAIRPPAPPITSPDASPTRNHMLAGLLIALGNAPLPLFYLVVVPQYIPREMSRVSGAALLSCIHLAMAGAWMTTIVHLIGSLRDLLRRPRVFLGLQVVTGALLLLLGIRSMAGATS